MKNFPLVLVAAFVGAVGFHLYYLSSPRDVRCDMDHRAGWQASDACRMDAVPAVYDPGARRALDRLVDSVAE